MITNQDAALFTFAEYRKLGTTKLSDQVLPVGTKVQTSEGVYVCSEPSRLALDANGNVYPVAESVFAKSYQLAETPGELTRAQLVAAIHQIDQTLRVPAAEYVPAIGDVFTLIERLRLPAGD
jgi:hypothetical protein